MQHSQARRFFSLLLSCTCYSRSCLGNSAVALLFITLFELHCRFTFFLASVTNVFMKTCEIRAFHVLMARLNIVCPLANSPYLKTQEHCFLCGTWAMESAYVCVVRPNKGSMQVVIYIYIYMIIYLSSSIDQAHSSSIRMINGHENNWKPYAHLYMNNCLMENAWRNRLLQKDQGIHGGWLR